MARPRTQFVCQNCGAVSHRWQGRCESCAEWNAIVEEGAPDRRKPGGLAAGSHRGRIIDLVALEGASAEPPRMPSGIAEFDRVTGGGFVEGSALLVGGEPGIGKSTLLLQACAAVAKSGRRAVYISGEESVDQIRMRARRLGVTGAAVELAAETCVEDILASIAEGPRPDFLVLDSIQTLWTGAIDSAPGTVGQVRAASASDDRLRQEDRRRYLPGRPCHQGRPDRRAENGGAYGRRRPFLRRRRRPPIPHRPRPEEPLRADRRDRGIRNDDGRARRSRQSVGAFPFRAQSDDTGRGGVCRNGRVAAGALRDPSTGRALPARNAAPRRDRLGLLPIGDGAGGSGGALRRKAGCLGRLSQCRRRAKNRRTGGRSRRRRGARLGAERAAPSRRFCLLRRNQPLRRAARCRPKRRAIARGRAARLHRRNAAGIDIRFRRPRTFDANRNCRPFRTGCGDRRRANVKAAPHWTRKTDRLTATAA